VVPGPDRRPEAGDEPPIRASVMARIGRRE
jgi:hypothetical protein